LDKKEPNFSDVKARLEAPEFLTYHLVLEVPQMLYHEVLKHYSGDIYALEPAQEFVSQYLRYRGDNGIVGLVGVEKKSDTVLIDAAVRYVH